MNPLFHREKKEKEIVLQFEPHKWQKEVLKLQKRFTVLVCHRGWGKTVLGVNRSIRGILESSSPTPRIAYTAPLRSQAKDLAWDYFKFYAAPVPKTKANEAELRLDIAGDRRINLYGVDNPDAIRGRHLDGVVLDEYGQFKQGVFEEIIRPAIAIKQGWALFMGTPKGRNEFWKVYEYGLNAMKDGDPDWAVFVYKASDTNIVSKRELEQIKKTVDASYYGQEFECSFLAAIVGAYYGDLMSEAEMQKRIDRVPWDPRFPVDTAWDLGVGTHLCGVFYQVIGPKVHFIDFVQGQGQDGIPEITPIVFHKPYTYRYHAMPWDVVHPEMSTGKTRIETFRSLGWRNIVEVPKGAVEDRINAGRMLLKRTIFDSVSCSPLVEALKNHRREYVKHNEDYKTIPVKDWSSHPADAFGAAAIVIRDERRPNQQMQAISEWDPYKPFSLQEKQKPSKYDVDYDEWSPSGRFGRD